MKIVTVLCLLWVAVVESRTFYHVHLFMDLYTRNGRRGDGGGEGESAKKRKKAENIGCRVKRTFFAASKCPETFTVRAKYVREATRGGSHVSA